MSFPPKYSHSSTSFCRVPLELPGELYVSPMPYGRYDRERVFRHYLRQKIQKVVVLLSDEEIDSRCRRDLKKLYARHQMEMIQFPMVDFLQPGHARMDQLIPELLINLRAGDRIAVHCHAGVGRSSVIVACLAAVILERPVDQVIAFLREHMETNITVEQKRFITGWVERLRENRPEDPVIIRTAEVIATGAELLQGRTLNRHGFTLGGLLTDFGITLQRETVLPDEAVKIRDAVMEALNRTDLVIITGGLGPTEDDCTREAVAEALGRHVVSHAGSDAHLQDYFDRMGRIPTEAQRRQARVIDGASAYMNPVGIAPGQRLTINNRRHVWLLPGPPRELDGLVRTALRPWLAASVARPDRHLRVFRILGHSESRVEERVRAHGIPGGVDVAYCARPGSVELRFTGPEAAVDPLREWVLREAYPEDVLNENGLGLEEEVGRRLLERGQSLTTAESCTAGGIAERITDVPGSSAYFLGGVVAYANRIKVEALGVDADILESEGAVSEGVALQMARGVRGRFGSDWGLGITGIAGPGGGSPEKPVGLFYVAVSGPGREEVRRCLVSGDRAQIRDHGVQRALELLWRCLRRFP